ncbi:protein BCCIP homolog isoform X2 [Prosopis cineraria]|uniref:protein BCCIP homolog isoform X2 n=1 Tax=Prosopis cineraria TaxID=364024 RepID=UPI00240EA7FC|nr:protein BCCIP homolog isoform X2 [Prosopis cineraria]
MYKGKKSLLVPHLDSCGFSLCACSLDPILLFVVLLLPCLQAFSFQSITMTRRPRRHSQRLKAQPLTFSRFARSVARLASTSKTDKKSGPSFTGNRFAKHTLEEKTEQSESSSEEFEDVVQADFSFFDPKPGDFHGVKNLLQTYLDDKQWDLSGFVDLILGQATVGTVVKVEDDEDEGLFAVVTALNLWRYREQKCIVELKDFLLKECKEEGTFDQLKLILGEQAHDVGLLVSQRVVNLPLQLLPHLYDALFDEVSWATEDEPTEELRNSFKFTHYIIYSKIYKHKNAEQNRKLNNDDDDAIIYVKPEDELFHKLSSWFFCFPLRTSQPETRELKTYRSMGLVMAVEVDKIPTFRQELRSLISEP